MLREKKEIHTSGRPQKSDNTESIGQTENERAAKKYIYYTKREKKGRK